MIGRFTALVASTASLLALGAGLTASGALAELGSRLFKPFSASEKRLGYSFLVVFRRLL